GVDLDTPVAERIRALPAAGLLVERVVQRAEGAALFHHTAVAVVGAAILSTAARRRAQATGSDEWDQRDRAPHGGTRLRLSHRSSPFTPSGLSSTDRMLIDARSSAAPPVGRVPRTCQRPSR